eukprot:gene9909-biopygen4893
MRPSRVIFRECPAFGTRWRPGLPGARHPALPGARGYPAPGVRCAAPGPVSGMDLPEGREKSASSQAHGT